MALVVTPARSSPPQGDRPDHIGVHIVTRRAIDGWQAAMVGCPQIHSSDDHD